MMASIRAVLGLLVMLILPHQPFQQWITELWQRKDERIGLIHASVDAERTE
ncbi:hypothetical protein [Vreelandella utahensis]|uniref:hypothetical protein n=1 Tax=Vreelandella halophila TaxID=86177 RepID=UPI0015C35A5E|nr:hypothetical protein [Halomonas utahensis]